MFLGKKPKLSRKRTRGSRPIRRKGAPGEEKVVSR